ncbi:uncharacterized protein [Lepeophtheirus salmonis]|uniref:uncharacterized protein isoform X2 n=1 Tax=Lepeophtheirus salmonis TaxID=72036 RepID=UPI001AE1B9AE|nr:uncharacterized protein LOC121130150 isoform X2 [Lepeophtheirus salmonis]
MFYHNSSLNRNECEGKRSGHRQSLADFSVKMTARNPLTASPLLSQRQSLMASDVGLLGRRAATQFDFFGGSSISTPAATTILSEYRNELPPKSIYNHMSGIPYSQPPQRRFIPGLNGMNGYCSDNDFCSLANESIASSSLPGQATGDISEINVNPGSTLKKGLLWQQRDKLFSRWKERFFILTKDYLQCFRRGSSRISEMGAFIFRIKLIEVEEVEIIDKRGYLTISLSMGKDGKVLLRKPDGIRDWFNILKECVSTCKERKGMMKSSKEFWSKKQFTDSSSMEQYIMARHRIGRPQYGYYVENESFPFDSNALPNHLRMKLKGCMNQISPAQGNISTNNLKHYGYIDVPRSSFRSSEGDDKAQLQSLCTDLYLKGNVRDYPSEYSHDSGVDSMNTNSSGSVMSGSITSPMMNRPSKFVFKSPEEDPLSLMHGKHLKPTTERDRKISLV